MRTKQSLPFALLLFVSAFSGCSQMLAPLKAGPASDSGFIRMANRMTDQHSQYPFHRSWIADEVRDGFGQRRPLFVAPVDISRVHNGSIWARENRRRAAAFERETREVAEYMRDAFINYLGKQEHSPFEIVESPVAHSLTIELAIVELTPTDIARSTMGLIASVVIPGGGLVAFRSQGAIAIEGRVYESDTGRELFLFADRERGQIAPFNLNDFTYFSHAHAIIDDWANQLALICRSPREAKVRDSLPVTLLPI